MKKLLTLALSVIMAVTLAAPAFADEAPLISPNPISAPAGGDAARSADSEREALAGRLGIPFKTADLWMDDETWEWIADHEEETKQFLESGLDSYVQEWGDYDSLEEMAKYWGGDQDSLIALLLEMWVSPQRQAEQSRQRAELAERLNIPAETDEYWLYSYTWEWIAAHEEETKQFLESGINDQVRSRGFDTLEELAEYWDWDQDSTVLCLLEQWVSERQEQEQLEQFEAGHPGMLEQFRANAYNYFSQRYFYYESPQKYMERWDLTEEEFIQEMVMLQISDRLEAEEQQAYVQQQKTEMGGVPGQLGVMVDGAYIAFSGAGPELVSDRTMVPAQPLLEALGGEAVLNGEQIQCTLNGIRVTFTLGSTQAQVETEGESALLEMDCAPYVKDGCAYIPIRFAGDALGCRVGWDDTFETAVVINAQRLADAIDQEFTILNRAMAAAVLHREEGMSLYGKAEGALALTLFDSLHGDKIYNMDLSEEFLTDDNALNVSLAITATEETIDLLLEDMPDDDLEIYMMMQAMLSDLGKMDVIATREGQSWFHSPVMDELSGESDVWFTMDTEQNTLQTAVSGLNSYTVGQLALDSVSNPSVFSWRELNEEVQEMAGEVGDGCFVTADGVSTLTIDLETLAEEDPYLWMEYAELSFTLTVDEEGQVTLSGCVENAPYYYGDTAARFTLDCTLSSGEMSLELEVHVANTLKLELSLTVQQQATERQPLTYPPEGAVVVDGDMPSPL